MYEYRYGGKNGRTHVLEQDDDLVVVRTRGRRPPGRAGRRRSRSLLASLVPVAEFPHANVEVLRVHAAAARAPEEVIRELEDDGAYRFVGHGLVDVPSGRAVVYTENLFLCLEADAKAAVAGRLAERHGLELRRQLDYAENAWFVAAPEGIGKAVFDLALSILADNPEVRFCHPEIIRERGEKLVYPEQWHLRETLYRGVLVDADVEVEPAWETSRGGGIVIAVIDDGVDVDHVEFRAGGKIVAPRDVTLASHDPRPRLRRDNHGTACAGVACAAGVDGASGVAPDAMLMPVRLMSGLGSQDEADAFAWAARNGADVISASWGPQDGNWADPGDPLHEQVIALPDSTRLAIEFAAQSGRGGLGSVICWAAGNGNEPVDNDGYASSPEVIAVGASNDRNRRAVYSDYGDALWCVFPSSDPVGALTPGIWTTDRRGVFGYNPGDDALGHPSGDYTNRFGGTSSACPGAAGVAALVLAKSPALTADDIRQILRETSDRIDAEHGGYDENGRSALYGYGRVNARRAVEAA